MPNWQSVAAGGLWAVAATALAAPMNYHETWDSYGGPGDPTFLAVWADLDSLNRFNLLTDNDNAFTGPNNLEYPGVNQDRGLINNLADGINNSQATGAELYPGQWVSPAADSELCVGMYLYISAPLANRKLVNTIIVISKGGQNVSIPKDATVVLPEPIPALAFGLINGWPDAGGTQVNYATPYFFDGKQWVRINAFATATGHNRLWMCIRSDGSVMLSELKGGGSTTGTAQYTGGEFDTLSLRANDVLGWVTARIDDVFLTGGTIGGVASPGACCVRTALGGGTCSIVASQTECQTLSGVWKGGGSTCGTNNANCDFCWPFADSDDDGDVDLDDFGVFQTCFTGATSGYLHPECRCLDRPIPQEGGGFLPPDNRVDNSDLWEFTKCWTGPAILLDRTSPPPGCAP